MKRIKLLGLFLFLICSSAMYGAHTFWLGADISGTTQLESEGIKLYNARGVVTENTKIMRQYGLNAVRLRVWVHPKGGWSDKNDVLKMALRAKKLGMAIMIDFHYSDWWADPGKQVIPAAWKNMNFLQMRKALTDHTLSTLRLLKDHGIVVRWVQIGNETTHGFLWPAGNAEKNMRQYAGFTEAGYKAVKQVYPKAKCIVHLDCGADQEHYDFIFDGLRKYGAKWDMIGLSVYPYWDQCAKITGSDEETITKVMANINHLYRKYGSETMIVETGYDADSAAAGKAFLKELIEKAAFQTNGHCRGVFYWAPELEGEYKLGAFRDHHPTIIMDAFKEESAKVK
ncbi:MAG: arabinogalactan endo-1,4-beta-galactosidase [Prevotella sp.]|jgi:arabinogalactan endo-1,4-beta-galactosidase|nr:arabinogalactan endo-1,4-beta-galactosidase [Prevotella sp.]MCH4017972.1 arabinogalactan endo-1,4-beta-galactosidase [Prevotella sp.]MCH4100832.1 arabinogalactan endo-1,4-beta-galactosidase [Prevotella sp.]MCI1292382.1 arabinogalactan endo-1,4-beta-galactosidase [Prevotella sp.]MCI1324420.1 arabinogalactan endo-1,4-beta-galactosidase [Prevotella sp.]